MRSYVLFFLGCVYTNIFLIFPSLQMALSHADIFIKQISDVVPIACRAAADAGIRSVCVTNFR